MTAEQLFNTGMILLLTAVFNAGMLAVGYRLNLRDERRKQSESSARPER